MWVGVGKLLDYIKSFSVGICRLSRPVRLVQQYVSQNPDRCCDVSLGSGGVR